MGIAAEWYTSYTVEHEIRQLGRDRWKVLRKEKRTHGEIEKVDEGPGDLLGHGRDGVDDDFAGDDEDYVYEPCTWKK
jgi:hypothetical protein